MRKKKREKNRKIENNKKTKDRKTERLKMPKTNYFYLRGIGHV